jgi:hypothetical protein
MKPACTTIVASAVALILFGGGTAFLMVSDSNIEGKISRAEWAESLAIPLLLGVGLSLATCTYDRMRRCCIPVAAYD